jgi:hypothetical protein
VNLIYFKFKNDIVISFVNIKLQSSKIYQQQNIAGKKSNFVLTAQKYKFISKIYLTKYICINLQLQCIYIHYE